jgi:diguanylate cyclase (GGDEF)-like protein
VIHAADTEFFDLAPIAMWLEDFSGVQAQFEAWRAEGITDIRAHLAADPARVFACAHRIRVIAVNAKTLELFEASSQDDLVANLAEVFQGEMVSSHVNELHALWEGSSTFSSNAVNYTLSGRRLDIQLRGQVLPGHEATLARVLVTTEDVTAREDARRGEEKNRRYAEGIFIHSPVSLWIEDFSHVKRLMEDIRFRGITDLRTFTDVHPEFVRQCMSEIRVIDVNQATLDLFQAQDKNTLLMQIGEVFRDEMEKSFREQLIELWNGNLFHHREVVNYALDGSERHVLLQFSVFPGHEQDWGQVQVALTDITARKRAEAYLEYLGKHDVLTRLHNRAFYSEELNRLERSTLRPVSAIIIDLNGLKEANDRLGHDAGDSLLRRLGEVLGGVASGRTTVARIGGDEFAILMPGGDRQAATAMTDTVMELLKINNQFYSNMPLSIAYGSATSEPGEKLEAMIRRADAAMYAHKRRHYESRGSETATFDAGRGGRPATAS